MGPFLTISEIRTVATEAVAGNLDWTHLFYVGTIVLSLVGDVMIPVLFFRFERNENSRRLMHAENKAEAEKGFNLVQRRLDHFDECLDSVRDRVLSAAATKQDVSELKEHLEAIMLSSRNTTANEIAELSKRIYRLEDRGFKKGWL